MKEKPGWEGGLGPYTPKLYQELDIGDYRTQFPEETKNLTDEQLFHAVSNADDDKGDNEWREYFAHASATAMDG